jgi:23S rRNA (uracil1939-C5)-methyltransferase
VAEIVLDIEHLDVAGDGVARHRGQKVTVPFTIPGERVRVSLDRSQKSAAALLEVVRRSPHRVSPRCAHFGVCGGCAWQHIAYAEQLRLKTELVGRLVQQAVPNAPAVRPMLAPTHQRVRAATRRALAAPWAPSSFHVNVHPRGDAFIFGPQTRRIPHTPHVETVVVISKA